MLEIRDLHLPVSRVEVLAQRTQFSMLAVAGVSKYKRLSLQEKSALPVHDFPFSMPP